MASFEHVNDLIGVIHRCMRRFFESQMKKYDITPPQFEVLVILWNEDGLVLSELGRTSVPRRTHYYRHYRPDGEKTAARSQAQYA